MSYGSNFGIVLVGLLLYALMFFLVSRIKNTAQIRKSLYLIMPNIFTMTALVFFLFQSSSILPPKPTESYERIDSLDKAEDRIRDLEFHSREVELYLNSYREQMFLLIGFLGLMFLIPLFVIAVGIAKPLEKSELN
jgi:hypothetical protein